MPTRANQIKDHAQRIQQLLQHAYLEQDREAQLDLIQQYLDTAIAFAERVLGNPNGLTGPVPLSEKMKLEPEQMFVLGRRAMTLTFCADFLGISRPALNDLLEQRPELLQAYKQGKSTTVGGVSGALIMSAQMGDVAAGKYVMNNTGGWQNDPQGAEDAFDRDGTGDPDEVTTIQERFTIGDWREEFGSGLVAELQDAVND